MQSPQMILIQICEIIQVTHIYGIPVKSPTVVRSWYSYMARSWYYMGYSRGLLYSQMVFLKWWNVENHVYSWYLR